MIETKTAANAGLSSGVMCAANNLRRANRVVSRLYDAVLKPSGLRATQFSVLRIVSVKGPVSVNHLAKLLVMDRTTLARDLKPLVREGFVKTLVDTTDNRIRLVMLTEKGRETLEIAQPLWQQAQQKMSKVLGEERLLNLIHELKEVVTLATKSQK